MALGVADLVFACQLYHSLSHCTISLMLNLRFKVIFWNVGARIPDSELLGEFNEIRYVNVGQEA